MKNRKDVIDLLHSADDSTIEKIAESDPHYDKKKADRLFREIERRVGESDTEYSGGEVSGVEHYRPRIIRRAVSVAACAAIVGAGVGSAYAFRGKSPFSADNSHSTNNIAGMSVEDVYDLCKHSSEHFANYSAEYEIYEKNDNIRDNKELHDPNNYYENTVICHTQVDGEKNTLWEKQTTLYELHGLNEKTYNTTSCFFDKSDKTIYTTSYVKDNTNYKTYRVYDSLYDTPLGGNHAFCAYGPFIIETDESGEPIVDLDDWTITGTKTVAGRECVILDKTSNFVDDEENERTDTCTTICIDKESGLRLELDFQRKVTYLDTLKTSNYKSTIRTNSITYNDNTGFVTEAEFKEFLKDYEPEEEGYDLSFLDESSNSGNTDIPGEITQESLYERMLDPLSNFDKCYIVYSSADENSSSKLAVSQSEGIYSIELSHVWDYSYKDKRISIPKNPNDKMIVENPSENLKERLFNKDSIINSYGDFSKWKITGTDTYLGRECALIEASYEDEIYFDPEEFKKTNGEHGRENVVYLIHVDLQTGIVLRVEVPTIGDGTVLTDASEVYFDEDAVSHITSPAEVREFIENGDYELEDGLDLSFLGWDNENNVPKYPTNENGQTYGTDLGDPDNNIGPPDLQAVQGNHGLLGYCYTTDLMLDPYAGLKPAEIVQKYQERIASVKRDVRYIKVYAVDGKTVIDTFTCGNSEDSAVPLPISLIYASLDTLEYHAISCDGLPTHKLTTPAGTVYLLHLGETAQDSYVWRRPSLIADDDNEAPLTEEVFDAIYENWDSLDIVELNYKG